MGEIYLTGRSCALHPKVACAGSACRHVRSSHFASEATGKTEVVKLSLVTIRKIVGVLEHCRTFDDVAKEKGLHFDIIIIAIIRPVGKMAWYPFTLTGPDDMRKENAQALAATG